MNTAHGRIQKDLKEVNKITDEDTPPIYCQPKDDNMENVEALIIGPPDTPYSFGYFHFDLKFPNSYPDKPPKCQITTTDNGRTRLNPNLYAGGKVCLSILGTWSGESADEWRSSYSLHYILRAIQSLIMTQKPYHNEPGYEEMNSNYAKPNEVISYGEKITHEVLRVAVCNVLENAIAKKDARFGELIKHNFLLWYDTYCLTAQSLSKKDGKDFENMPFEYSENGAFGKFNSATLLQRLHDIRSKLDSETNAWKDGGFDLTKAETGWKYFKLLEESDKIKKGVAKIDGISAGPVTNDNIFHWNASIFGPENSMWEGGIYNLELVFSDADGPPRVRFLTKMWHPQITKDGIPFYTVPPGTKEPVVPVLLALQKLLKMDPNSSSATWANPEAAKQFFNKDKEQQKIFKKEVSRCVRRSIDG